ncbi:DNA-binding MurR/RpiR family transcriptional regulator [Actinoplanes octamycinicus]|uniref:DNA-binding MurR/RpiR family transcriptional regulator n=1 Tax=Actinoplanes octamycinicus TaxID=135948 RepID=A0A7W7MAW2_9ACTN|nr:MurR/RpiR family transcriptional regulator [Actinoplanes octamycinicus]MBB4743463.1 DNA-binding MurR/RpiR family transcriptional regulator [Actinoplanes octamycinicus]GIE62552.1 RpiR family transcriptional regulator [Actinoplanes octamycinicus]
MAEPEMDGTASTAVADTVVRDQDTAGNNGTTMSLLSTMGIEHSSADGVLVRLRTLLPEFTGALKRVAEQVIADPAAASRATIVELAERSGTSPATVTRFCRAMGFDGYADLRLGIAAETGRARSAGWTVDIGREIQPNDPLERVLGQIMAADTQAMHDTANLLDLAEVERAAGAIAGARRVNIFGASGSALVGEEMQFSLHRIGIPCWAWTDTHNGLASAALSKPGDVALGISHSGETGETIELLAEASSRGATTIALTSFPRSPLAELADIVLLTATQATTFRPDALSARHPQLVVCDLVYVAVAQRTHERSHAAFQRTAQAVQGHKAAKGSAP